MRQTVITIATLALLGTALPAAAQNQAADKPRSTEKMAEDVVTQPVEDVGIDKKDIPENLLRIQDKPYSLVGIKTCAQIRSAIGDMDAVLGEDLDVPYEATRDDKRKDTAGKIGGLLVNSIIPFRGVIREISGAAAQERRYNAAVYAGVVRRSFLKGVGLQRGCKYPAAPDPKAVK
ncbi:hypothetical protein C7451_101126 [Blastomonas natatoria]|uniref:Uncharacterized protein n=1 Tax=Blastomonas natatoria TaxID=34015 RepID=A0A2V3VD21_9SPHN|nr:hypothetical protein [Blastomonas natatoria]PXW79064.1 hypothetical protein C7451_101126 [Blastomonas natatoria]